MAYNIDFTAAIKFNKPDNHSKKVDFSNSAGEKTYSFKDSLKDAVRSKSENELTTDDRTAIRKEMVNKSEPKLKDPKKLDSPEDENVKSTEENKEKHAENINMTIEQIFSKLEELTKLQQQGEMPKEKYTTLLEGIKEAIEELGTAQTKSIGLEASNLQTKTTELTVVLEGILQELKTNGSFNEKVFSEDFAESLKAILTQTSSESEAIKNSIVDNKTADISMKPETKTTNTTETNKSEVKNETITVMENQSSEKNNNMTTASNQTNKTADNKNPDMKSEVPVVNAKTTDKEVQPASEENTEDLKAALGNKVEKLTVNSKENNKQGAGEGNVKEFAKEADKVVAGEIPREADKVVAEEIPEEADKEVTKEAPKEIHKMSNTTQKSPVSEDMSAIKLDQTIIDNKIEAEQNQAAAKPAVVNKAEVLNQIVKKAEIVFTESQPEIRMQLEPENLGKLTLKLAVEKGLITAKFVTESYEVKQIIESNFNELKDMLQEKGLEVQNFSVSVGQQSKEFNNNSFQQWKETIRLNGRSMNRGRYEGYMDGEGTLARTANPYSVHNGEFDHRA